VAALQDYSARLRPGERATVMCLAVDRDQARIVHRYISGYFNTVPLLQPYLVKDTDEVIELNNGVEIIVATNSFRAVRGRTIVCAIFDEVAYWRSEEAANPDIEVANAIEPGLATMPNSMLIGISSPYRRSGLLFERWRKHYGQPDDNILVVHGPTLAFNPTVPKRIIDQALERDPEAASAEWLAQWRTDLADFVSRDVVEQAVVDGRYELAPDRTIRYYAFVDPSGAVVDSMTLAIAHSNKAGHAVLDLVREVRPPFVPQSIANEFAGILKTYGLHEVHGDRYGGEWPPQAFAEVNIRYIQAEHPKSDLYLSFLPLLNSGRVELLDHPRLIHQLCSLERRTGRSGKDTIDHPKGGHDDIVNAVAGAVVLAADAKHQRVVVSDAVLQRSRMSAGRPQNVVQPGHLLGQTGGSVSYSDRYGGR
jgi:hypothetical protein